MPPIEFSSDALRTPSPLTSRQTILTTAADDRMMAATARPAQMTPAGVDCGARRRPSADGQGGLKPDLPPDG